MKRPARSAYLLVIAMAVMISFQPIPDAPSPLGDSFIFTGIGDLNTLESAYERWRDARADSAAVLTLALTTNGRAMHANRHRIPFGRAAFDLVNGRLRVDTQRLPEPGPFDVWLIDHAPRPNSSRQGTADERKIFVGQLQMPDGTLQTTLDATLLHRFELDQIIVTQQGRDPQQGGLLYGSPTLFQRLYVNRHQPRSQSEAPAIAYAPFRALVPPPAQARSAQGAMNDERATFDGSLSLDALVQVGEELFFTETFDGNGRTCGTCHPITASFTLGTDDIASLPDDNPLFVAEFVPALASLERPDLIREFGLILENIDGFQDPTAK